MPPLRSRITAQGRISVPAEIQRKLGIEPGSLVEWHIEGDSVIVRKGGPYSSADIRRALFPTPPKPRTLEELKQGIADYIVDKHGRH
jgi:AbrB family looped-hinge helix DNA binding protein